MLPEFSTKLGAGVSDTENKLAAGWEPADLWISPEGGHTRVAKSPEPPQQASVTLSMDAAEIWTGRYCCLLPGSLWELLLTSYPLTCSSSEQDMWLSVTDQFLPSGTNVLNSHSSDVIIFPH